MIKFIEKNKDNENEVRYNTSIDDKGNLTLSINNIDILKIDSITGKLILLLIDYDKFQKIKDFLDFIPIGENYYRIKF